MQWTHGEFFFADQRIQQGGLAGADATEYGNVQVTVLQLFQHRLHGFVIVREGIANAGWQARVFDEVL